MFPSNYCESEAIVASMTGRKVVFISVVSFLCLGLSLYCDVLDQVMITDILYISHPCLSVFNN